MVVSKTTLVGILKQKLNVGNDRINKSLTGISSKPPISNSKRTLPCVSENQSSKNWKRDKEPSYKTSPSFSKINLDCVKPQAKKLNSSVCTDSLRTTSASKHVDDITCHNQHDGKRFDKPLRNDKFIKCDYLIPVKFSNENCTSRNTNCSSSKQWKSTYNPQCSPHRNADYMRSLPDESVGTNQIYRRPNTFRGQRSRRSSILGSTYEASYTDPMLAGKSEITTSTPTYPTVEASAPNYTYRSQTNADRRPFCKTHSSVSDTIQRIKAKGSAKTFIADKAKPKHHGRASTNALNRRTYQYPDQTFYSSKQRTTNSSQRIHTPNVYNKHDLKFVKSKDSDIQIRNRYNIDKQNPRYSMVIKPLLPHSRTAHLQPTNSKSSSHLNRHYRKPFTNLVSINHCTSNHPTPRTPRRIYEDDEQYNIYSDRRLPTGVEPDYQFTSYEDKPKRTYSNTFTSTVFQNPSDYRRITKYNCKSVTCPITGRVIYKPEAIEASKAYDVFDNAENYNHLQRYAYGRVNNIKATRPQNTHVQRSQTPTFSIVTTDNTNDPRWYLIGCLDPGQQEAVLPPQLMGKNKLRNLDWMENNRVYLYETFCEC